jgi:molecular chaperone GrpE
MSDDDKNVQVDQTTAEESEIIQQLQKEKNELENKWKRALADYHNLERQGMREKAEFMKMASAMVCAKFVDVLDHLEQAVGGMSEEEKKSGWAMGVVMTLKQFREVLKEEGLYEIEAEGGQFDPHYMEAVERVDGQKDTVVKVLRKGYKTFEGKVLRPAQVLVGKGEE